MMYLKTVHYNYTIYNGSNEVLDFITQEYTDDVFKNYTIQLNNI